MGYKFQKFTTVYPVFVRQFLDKNPGYEQLSYRELYNRFIKTRYGLSNFYATHMKALGNEAQDLFASFEPLQKAWAREHGVSYEENSWLRDIVLAQVEAFQPDILYLQSVRLFDQAFRQQLREVCNEQVSIIGWRAAPTKDFTVFGDLDLFLTAAPNIAEKLREGGVNVVQMPLAFDHTILDEVKLTPERELDFTFTGTLGTRHGTHSRRYAMIERIMPYTPLQVWGRVSELRSPAERVLAKGLYIVNRILGSVGVSREQRARLPLIQIGASWISDPTLPSIKLRYPERFHEPLFGLENYEVLARSRIAFNNHIDCAENYAGNVRLYEATGMGACLLTDWRVNLSKLFEPDVEVVTYRNAEECIEKVRYLLDHEDERQSIATAGQQRTLRDHTYAQRVKQLDSIIRQAFRC